MDRRFLRALIALAALCGGLGVALSAAAAHAAPGLAPAASMLLAHMPAFLAVAFVEDRGLAPRIQTSAAAFMFGAGLLLFCGDLAARRWMGGPLFAMAAPLGGTTLLIGWGSLLLAVLFPVGPKNPPDGN